MTAATMARPTRYALDPVARWALLRLGPDDNNGQLDLSGRRLAEYLGVSRRSVVRWQRTGITSLWADRLAVRLGHHPSYFWPEWGRLR